MKTICKIIGWVILSPMLVFIVPFLFLGYCVSMALGDEKEKKISF